MTDIKSIGKRQISDKEELHIYLRKDYEKIGSKCFKCKAENLPLEKPAKAGGQFIPVNSMSLPGPNGASIVKYFPVNVTCKKCGYSFVLECNPDKNK